MDDGKEIAMNDQSWQIPSTTHQPQGLYGEYYNLTIGYAAIESAW